MKFIKYWQLNFSEKNDLSKTKLLKNKIDNCINLHTDSQKRIKSLITLSGGLDSTYIQSKNISQNFISMSISGKDFNSELNNIKKFVKKKNLITIF